MVLQGAGRGGGGGGSSHACEVSAAVINAGRQAKCGRQRKTPARTTKRILKGPSHVQTAPQAHKLALEAKTSLSRSIHAGGSRGCFQCKLQHGKCCKLQGATPTHQDADVTHASNGSGFHFPTHAPCTASLQNIICESSRVYPGACIITATAAVSWTYEETSVV